MALDKVSIAGTKDKIVLLDVGGVSFFTYQRISVKAGAKAILFQYGNIHYPDKDIEQRDLREAVVGEAKKSSVRHDKCGRGCKSCKKWC